MNENDSHISCWVRAFDVPNNPPTDELVESTDSDGKPYTWVSAAPIIRPESNQVIKGEVVQWCHHSDGNHYAILCVDGEPAYVSVRADINIMNEDRPGVQARPVWMDGLTKAWEFFHWKEDARWELIPRQHLKSKTATAQEWLAEIEMKIIPNLDVKAAELLAERLKLQVSHRALNPTGENPLSEDTAAAYAKAEWLGSDYKKACQARKAAELRCQKADVALHRRVSSTKKSFRSGQPSFGG